MVNSVRVFLSWHTFFFFHLSFFFWPWVPSYPHYTHLNRCFCANYIAVRLSVRLMTSVSMSAQRWPLVAHPFSPPPPPPPSFHSLLIAFPICPPSILFLLLFLSSMFSPISHRTITALFPSCGVLRESRMETSGSLSASWLGGTWGGHVWIMVQVIL